MNECKFCDGKISMIKYFTEVLNGKEMEIEHWECEECKQLYIIYLEKSEEK